ncbi:MAG: stage 0 sporulation family protein [Bacteroidales bacterium]
MEKDNTNKQDINEELKAKLASRGCTELPDAPGAMGSCCSHKNCKLDSFNWLSDVVDIGNGEKFLLAEVRFKNNRKEFFSYSKDLSLHEGDIVAVEATPGHDIGIVCLIGDAVRLQVEKKRAQIKKPEFRKIYRKAKPNDIEKWFVGIEKEDNTMSKSREIVSNLELEMKINDVEFQGDNTKAIFYYTAEDRVDFRVLIKKLAEAFRVRIEMRQIGVRQEAGKLGGIGSCGRELCCSTWMTNFRSVTTNTARVQQLSLNPQKLAGQCGKLKCCLNFEYDGYREAVERFPNTEIPLKTKKGLAIHQKTDVFQEILWYSYENDPARMIPIPLRKLKKIIDRNKRDRLIDKLEDYSITKDEIDFQTDFQSDPLPEKPKPERKKRNYRNHKR